MTHVLFRPHVAGGENQITTPDVVIDRLAVECDGTSRYAPVQRVTTRVAVQALPGDLTLVPAYALIAAGRRRAGRARGPRSRLRRPPRHRGRASRAQRVAASQPRLHFQSLEMSFDAGEVLQPVP